MRLLTFLLAALAAVPALAQPVLPLDMSVVESRVGKPEGPPLSGAALDAATDSTAALLRCPVCQGLSVNDSPSEMAVNMKRQVRMMLAQGYTRDQVIGYFESSYGEFVRLEPKREGLNWIVWLAPLIALLVGGWIVWRTVRRTMRSGGNQTDGELAPELDVPPDLEPWVRRVREIAYGREEASR